MRQDVMQRLHGQLAEIIPGATVWIYGSLVSPNSFSGHSDIDIAIESMPGSKSIEYLQSVLSAATGYPVDIVWLGQSRLEEKIRRTGCRWTV
ncbi:MAG: nucleotidyltransferase domain-containing protein [Planctomycetaceae bacterium]